MPVSNIFGQTEIQPRSIQDFDNANMVAQSHQQALQVGQLNLLQTLKTRQDEGTLRNALMSLGGGATDDQRIDALKNTGLPAGFTQADALQKALLERQKTTAEVGKFNADSDKTRQQVEHDRITFGLQGLAGARTPADAAAVAVKAGIVPFSDAATYQQSIPTAPDGSIDPTWRRNQMMQGVDLQEQIKLGMPTIQTRNTGGSTDTLAIDPMTGQVKVTNSVPNTQSPDSLGSNRTQVQVANINQAGQDRRNAATIGKDYRVAGLDPQGGFVGYGASTSGQPAVAGQPGPTPPGGIPQPGAGLGPSVPHAPPQQLGAAPAVAGPQGAAAAQPGAPAGMQAAPAAPMQALVDAIGTEKIPLATALARMQPVMKNVVMAQLAAQYPKFDPTAVGARQAAAKAFGPGGPLGNTMRSIATANDHLGQLDQLGDALQNGNIQLINKVGNAFGVQTGQAPVAVFNAVKNIVGQEVVKSLVANGGSEREREEAAKAFSTDSSPAQLKGTIAAYRGVMGAQHANLLTQRRAAGLPDNTLPNYAPFSGSPSTPTTTTSGGGFDPAAIAAELKRRGH